MKALFPTTYLSPISYYAAMVRYEETAVEKHENFVKQTFRNRCNIYGAGGKQALIIPIQHKGKKQVVKDVRISYDHSWQKQHWKSIEAAYRSSPFFEYYEDDLYPFYHTQKHNFLFDFNEALCNIVIELIDLKIKVKTTSEYIKQYESLTDFRNHEISLTLMPYSQVFADRSGFISDLSIVDLIFNKGNDSKYYLCGLKDSICSEQN